MAQPPPERASSGDRPRAPAPGPRGNRDRPLTDGHLLALLGAADPALHAAISILALSGMRLAELRRLRVGQCGRGSFRVGECRANDGPREVPVHSALAETVARLTSGRVKDAFLVAEGADFGQSRSALERRFDACRAAVGVVGPSPGIHGLRRWFVRTALDAEQPHDAIAAVVGLLRSEDARPKPTWGQRRACVEAVQLPKVAP